MTIPARRMRGGAPIVLIACVGLIVAPPGAVGKPKRADLSVTAVVPSAAPTAGAKVTLRVTVRNTGKLAAAKSQLAVSLESVRTSLARADVAKLKPGRRTTVAVAVTFPKPTAPGRYRVTVCADAAKKVKETSESNNCRALSQALVVAAPAAAPVVVPSAPAPAPPDGPAANQRPRRRRPRPRRPPRPEARSRPPNSRR